VEYENSHLDESAEYFALKDLNNFWTSCNAKYNKRVNNADTYIDGSTLPSKIVASFREFYASIYVNSADDECKVTEYTKHRLHYIGDNKTVRRKHCARAGCSKVRTPPARPSARPLSQAHRQDRLQYTAPQLASVQRNERISKYCSRDVPAPLCVRVDYRVAMVAFAMLGKALISVTFCCIYVFTNEIFPTEVRNIGVGTAVMFGGVSNMAAAYFGGPLVSMFVSLLVIMWLDGRVTRVLNLAINRSRVQIPAAAMSSATVDKLFTHVYVYFLSPSSIIWYRRKLGR